MSLFPPDSEEKVIRLPSGDHRGEWVELALSEVNCIGFEPAESAAQISGLPERLDEKATLEPSGLTCGKTSTRVDAITCSGLPALPDKSSLQMFESLLPAVKTILPDREMVAEATISPAGFGRGLLADGVR